MSTTGHILPFVFVVLLWFASTALVVWLDNRPERSFRPSLTVAGILAVVGFAVIALAAPSSDATADYASFAASFAIWGWHELSFLTGKVTGPRRVACPPGVRGWTRFRLSAATVMHHELALAATVIVLGALTWNATTATGTLAFAILFAMRLSTKFNLFLGVPNFSADILPPHLAYLESYFRARPFNALMPFSLALAAGATFLLARTALAANGDAAVGWSLLTGLALLGVVEHLFLILPIRDGALWRWAIPARIKEI